MAGKTSGTSRKSTPSKKSAAQRKTAVTPLDQDNSAPQQNVPVTQLYPGIEEEIRNRAYELYEERGRQEGFHEEDWIRAEAEVLQRYRREKSA